jgi:tRNA-dihydrouridine synthase
LTVAKILEDNGAALIAVHGRTKEQAYKGVADWDPIGEIKQTVRVPVIGNGDVKTVADIARITRHTGCDGVMIGRAAIGNPWIFQRKDREQVTLQDTLDLMRRHLRAMLDYYGERGLILFRKHATRYIHAVPGASALRHALVTAETEQKFFDLLDECELRAKQGGFAEVASAGADAFTPEVEMWLNASSTCGGGACAVELDQTVSLSH